MVQNDDIEILGASENNLKHIDVTIPKGKLVVFAGVSGSGKSSLAFDTVAVESCREWQQSYPLFLRNKMPHYDRPSSSKSCRQSGETDPNDHGGGRLHLRKRQADPTRDTG